jgi:hypothetical protein
MQEKNIERNEIICLMAEELWIKMKNTAMPDTLSIKDKLQFYEDNHINYLQSFRNPSLYKLYSRAKTTKHPIKQYENYNIKKIKEDVLRLNENLWFTDVSRQKNYFVHKQTQSLINTDVSIFYKSGEPFVVKESNVIPYHIKKQIWTIINDLETRFNGRVAKSIFARLNSNCFIQEHSDNFEYLRMVHRFHIPILTNKNVIFKVGDQSLNMKEGECYEVDVSLLHSVYNNGNSPRIHLIIDIMPNELIT